MKLIYENYYCTEDGKVFNATRNKEVNGYVKDDEYLYITINSKSNKRKDIRKHRMIYEYFYGPIPNGYIINHLDGNKQNNSIHNLEMTTAKGNAQHAAKIGLLSGWSRKSQRVLCVELNREFKSIRETERELGLPRYSIRLNPKAKNRFKNKVNGLTFKKV